MERASAAITQQLRAISRLDTARLRQDVQAIPALEQVLQDAKLTRENAVAAYKEHRRERHGAADAVSNGS